MARKSTARLSPKLGPPCKDCGRPTLVWPNGATACTHGGHALERQVSARPKKVRKP